MSKVVNLLEKRWSIRSISTENLEAGIVQDLIDAARLTPSCYNKQPWRFLFLESQEARDKGFEALAEGNYVWAVKAPLLIIGYSRPEDDCVLNDGREYHQFDLGMSVMNIMLTATEYDLVARPMAGFDASVLHDAFDIPRDYTILVVIAVGYPSNDTSHLPERLKELPKRNRERIEPSEFVKRL